MLQQALIFVSIRHLDVTSITSITNAVVFLCCYIPCVNLIMVQWESSWRLVLTDFCVTAIIHGHVLFGLAFLVPASVCKAKQLCNDVHFSRMLQVMLWMITICCYAVFIDSVLSEMMNVCQLCFGFVLCTSVRVLVV